jgi:hypothetical protein
MRSNLARSLALLVIFCAGAGAQDSVTADQAAEIDAFEPAVSAEDLSSMDSTAPDPSEEAGSVVEQDVRRTENSTGVMDEIDLGLSEVTGNQELPKVLYIVPWQKSEPGGLFGKPVNTLLDEVLAPIDRTEFMRRVDYYSDLYGDKEE